MTTRCVQPIAVLLMCASLGAGCNRPSQPAKSEPPALSVTHWTEQTELFMEYPPLVAGRSARFAVHLTRLSDFSALNAGTPGIELVPSGGGATVVLKGSAPSRPGAFRVEGVLPAAGQYRWTLTIDAPGIVDRHDLGAVTVFADEATANADAAKQPADDPAAVAIGDRKPPWLAQQQIEFRRSVRRRELGDPVFTELDHMPFSPAGDD